MNEPWRHHSVPQSVLRHFSDADDLLWHFDKRAPKQGISKLGPKGIFFGEHQYSTIDCDTGEFDPALEHFFDRDVEHPAAPVIEKILTATRGRRAPRLTPDEKDALNLFMQFQVRRVPELARKYVPDFEADVAAGLAKAEAESGPLPEDVVNYFTRNRASLTRNAIVKAQGQASAAIADLQRNRGLLIAVIADAREAFVIGSNPMAVFPAPGFREFGVSGPWMPISSQVAISNGGPPGTEDLRGITDRKAIRRLNELLFEQSDEIAGCWRALIELLINRR